MSQDIPEADGGKAPQPRAGPPLFSIVTVVYNDLPGLKLTQASVESQDFREFEWIVIDGASTDGTAEYLRELVQPRGDQESADPEAGRPANVAVSEPDKGIYDAMNKGLARASGKWVTFLNAGDTFAGPEVLSRLAPPTGAGKYDFVYGDALENDGTSLLLKKARNIKSIRYSMFTHHQAMLYRRAFLAEQGIRYDDRMRVGADYAFTASVYKRGAKVVAVPFPICIFERGGASHQLEAVGRREVLQVQREILGLGRSRLFFNEAGFHLSSFLRRRFRRTYDAVRFRRKTGKA